jgi:hypothetical protein
LLLDGDIRDNEQGGEDGGEHGITPGTATGTCFTWYTARARLAKVHRPGWRPVGLAAGPLGVQ